MLAERLASKEAAMRPKEFESAESSWLWSIQRSAARPILPAADSDENGQCQVVIDHTRLEVWIGGDGAGNDERPCLTVMIDAESRALIGSTLTLSVPGLPNWSAAPGRSKLGVSSQSIQVERGGG